MSELSTVAIKDGHRGHLPHFGQTHAPSSGLSNQLDAERADRISRLAGMERVTAGRNPAPVATGNLTPGAAAAPQQQYTSSYFDATGNPAIGRERSTVGSASATGSVGARTTWAGSEVEDVDKMSESQDMDMDTSSMGGMSEGGGEGSLVAFGEGARTPAQRGSMISSPGVGNKAAGATPTNARDAKMIDGMTYDQGVVDTTTSSADTQRNNRTYAGHTINVSGAEQAERIVREHMDTTSADRMRTSNHPGELGRLQFEK